MASGPVSYTHLEKASLTAGDVHNVIRNLMSVMREQLLNSLSLIHIYHLPLRGLLLPEGGDWRILSTIKLLLNTIDYQIIIFLINFTTKFEEEPP